ncbi:hypothetical protein EBU91_04080, partial [bacterium]|nr:hypothetical protein [bacterium]
MKFILFFTILISYILCFSQQQFVTFNYTGNVQTWVVPSCVTSINVLAAGAKGGGNNGGNGARVSGVISVT